MSASHIITVKRFACQRHKGDNTNWFLSWWRLCWKTATDASGDISTEAAGLAVCFRFSSKTNTPPGDPAEPDQTPPCVQIAWQIRKHMQKQNSMPKIDITSVTCMFLLYTDIWANHVLWQLHWVSITLDFCQSSHNTVYTSRRTLWSKVFSYINCWFSLDRSLNYT